MFIAVNSTPINVKKIFFGKFLCLHILHDKAALNYIVVFYLFVSVQLRSIPGDVA